MSSSSKYKYCIVPMCTNTTSTAPEKIFFDVPRKAEIRKRWCHLMKRDENKNPEFSEKCPRHICQDHFDLETDTENYVRHKVQGVNLKLKKGALPHIFACQKNKPPALSTERAAKRQRKNTVNDILSNSVPSTSDEIIFISSDDVVTTAHIKDDEYKDAICQVNIKPGYRSKCTSTTTVSMRDFGCQISPHIQNKACNADIVNLQESVKENCAIPCTELFECDKDTSNDYHYECLSGSDYDPEDDEEEDKKAIRNCMLKAIQKNPLMCLGIQKEEAFLIDYLSKHAKSLELNVIITLKKIRQNETYEQLGMLFGMSASNVGRIFKDTLFLLAGVLQNFVYWPADPSSIKLCLPVAFRRKYYNVQSIIDCFEIPIEKPTNPLHQSLTWSEYYKDNTIKYLVSCTPDGTVSFISKGYGGRASDTAIVEDCGYLNMLFPHLDVMADRGFKNVSCLLQQLHCHLIRPPSVVHSAPMSAEDVKTTKQVAAVRVHVERVINRLRNFSILSKHTCVDRHLVQLFDQILIVVCGLINFQNKLIKV